MRGGDEHSGQKDALTGGVFSSTVIMQLNSSQPDWAYAELSKKNQLFNLKPTAAGHLSAAEPGLEWLASSSAQPRYRGA